MAIERTMAEKGKAAERKNSEGEGMSDREERLEQALRRIIEWAGAYPQEAFVPPTPGECEVAHNALVRLGMSLDKFSSHAMRHCLMGAKKIAEEALNDH